MSDPEQLSEAERLWLLSALVSVLVAHRSPRGAPMPIDGDDHTMLIRLLGKLSGVDKVVTIGVARSGPSHDA